MSNVTEQWLISPSSIKGIFVEVVVNVYDTVNLSWNETTLYLSNTGYLTQDSLVSYQPIISGGLQLTESISLDGNVAMSYGDIAINNYNGELDTWLDNTRYIWANRAIKVYLGDPQWQSANIAQLHTNFELIFSGLVDDVDSSSRETLNLKIRDSLDRLNTTITENKLGTYGTWAGGQTNKDTIRPLIFGEVFNITPQLIDPSTLEYMFLDTSLSLIDGVLVTATSSATSYITCASTKTMSIGNQVVFSGTASGNIVIGTTYYIKSIPSTTQFSISATLGGTTLALATSPASMLVKVNTRAEGVLEIRDNGVPIYNSGLTSNVTIDLNKGTFKLLKAPAGTITCSVQGIPLNINLTSGAVTTSYKNTLANTIAVICTQYGNYATRLSVSELDLVNLTEYNNTPVGYYISDRDNVLTACQNILSSIGAQLYMNKAGKLQILRLGIPTSDAVVAITDRDIIQHTLQVSNKVPVLASNKLGYAKNWTVQTGLLTNIPTAHKDQFAEEWLTTTITDATTKATYSLDSAPVQKDTMLIAALDADIEATRLTNYFKTPKVVYRFTGTSRLLTLKLGQQVFITHNRFNLNYGKQAQVISLSYDWLQGTVNVEVII